LNAIQILYSNLICATTLGFVCASEPAEEGIMNLPPRRVGKSLIGRYMFLRIMIGTVTLTGCVVASVFWLQTLGEKYGQYEERALAFNVLDFGAISITLSARFALNSSFSTKIFSGNKWCWVAIGIFVALQLATTYIPGLNNIVFEMSPMDGVQWGITFLFMVVVFIVMEVEKYIRIYITHQSGGITDDDAEEWIFDKKQDVDMVETRLPVEAEERGLTDRNIVVTDDDDEERIFDNKQDVDKVETSLAVEAEELGLTVRNIVITDDDAEEWIFDKKQDVDKVETSLPGETEELGLTVRNIVF
jgi:hypothetical protein